MRRTRRKGPGRIDPGSWGGEQSVPAQQIGQRNGTERRRGVGQEPPAVEQMATDEREMFRVRLHGKNRNSLLLKRARQTVARPWASTTG